MDLPKVSIMIPTYNQQKYILRAIESARSQNYQNIEVVIADDNSPDETHTIVGHYLAEKNDPRIKYFKNDKNIGILRNYKKSLYEYASGDWVINLDGDDFFIDTNFISDAIKLAQEDKLVVLVFGNYSEFYQDSLKTIEIINSDLPSFMSGEDFVTRFSKEKVSFNHNSVLYKRAIAIQVGFYWDEHVPRNDWESVVRLCIGNRVGYITNVASAWTQHDANETRRSDIKKYLNNYALIRGISVFATNSGVDAVLVSEWTHNMLYTFTRGACIAYIRNKDFYGAVLFLSYAYKENKMLPLKLIFNPGVVVRALLSIDRSLYVKVKALVRKLSLH